MPIEEIIAASPTETVTEIANTLGSVGKWLQAIGLVVIIWLIANIINWMINKKRLKTLYSLKEDITRVENKIDKLAKKSKS